MITRRIMRKERPIYVMFQRFQVDPQASWSSEALRLLLLRRSNFGRQQNGKAASSMTSQEICRGRPQRSFGTIFSFWQWLGTIQNYHKKSGKKMKNIRTFQNRAECPHTTSGYFFSISWKMHKTTRIFGFFCVRRKYRYRGVTQDVVWRRSIRFWEAQRS